MSDKPKCKRLTLLSLLTRVWPQGVLTWNRPYWFICLKIILLCHPYPLTHPHHPSWDIRLNNEWQWVTTKSSLCTLICSVHMWKDSYIVHVFMNKVHNRGDKGNKPFATCHSHDSKLLCWRARDSLVEQDNQKVDITVEPSLSGHPLLTSSNHG